MLIYKNFNQYESIGLKGSSSAEYSTLSERTENEVLKETELIKLEEDQISTMVAGIFAQ